mmetsp:Transcript_3904/g.9965  ORF Transcript_3904/g.9965 Transcript_3904/m.9965 type:complete len:176 (-) Transcript_3904:103-630(-)
MEALQRIIGPCLPRYRYTGGGPAPLLQNPSAGLNIIFTVLNIIVGMICVASLLIIMRFESTCEEPLVEFLVCVGVASCVATSYNFYLAFISETSDTCWWMIMALDFFINVARFVICYYGLQMLGRMQHVCSDAEAQVVRLNCVSIVVATTLLGLTDYFMYLPNFVLQLSRLRSFK